MFYTPPHYRETREELIYEIIQNFSFATLISVTAEGPYVSHLPVLLDLNKKALLSHCAKANPHWKLFKGNPVTLVFTGPHAYISPAWYEPALDNVPTWNYVAVHVQGKVKIIEDVNESWSLMNKLVQHYEKHYQTGWSLPSEPNEELKNDLNRGITVFEISLDKIEAKFKLSQNQNQQNRNTVIKNLPHTAGEQGKLLAEYMKQVLKPT